jgi:hypothetical protein
MEFQTGFGRYASVGDTIESTRDEHGRFLRATIEHDPDMGEPWKEHDGHGVVSDWRKVTTKAPGERVLYESERGRVLFYDVQESMKIAKRDGWGCAHVGAHLAGNSIHKTPGEMRACAVNRDFEALRAWCRDEWTWCGVVVSLHQECDDDTIDLDPCVASLWGIDLNYPDSDNAYLLEVANDLAAEAKTTRRVVIEAGA